MILITGIYNYKKHNKYKYINIINNLECEI
jgi:hypothetical protein